MIGLKSLSHQFIRTRLCDPMFTNDTARINEISEKAFGRLVAANITDVSSRTSRGIRIDQPESLRT